MKKLLILLLALLCIFALTFAFASCGDTQDDTQSDTQSDTQNDTQSDTNTDTNVDTSTDTNTDTDTDTDDTTVVPDKPVIDPALQAKVDELLYSKHKLTYNEDGSFRVLIIADAHMNTTASAGGVQDVKDRVKVLVDRVNPNLVIYTGDNTINSSSEAQLRANIDAIAGYLEEKHIPWCHVYGNHDHENALSNERQQPIYESYEYCISKDTLNLSGTGNYVHAVYNADGSIGSVIYCLDSGAYSQYGYGYVQDDQIKWYKETSLLLKEYNGGVSIPGMMAFHIPMYENRLAYENRQNSEIVLEWNGQRNENICSSDEDASALFETMLELGDIKLAVSGHDHVNDYMFNYKGIKLASSPNISDLTYNNRSVQGSRVIDLNSATINNIPTYVTYLIERPNPDDFGTLDTNVAIELTKDQIENPVKGNGNNGSVNGKLNITVVENKGVDGSEAIKIHRGNSDNFDIFFDMTNKGKLGGNKYLILYADFTETELSKGCFGLITERGIIAPYTSKFAPDGAVFYYLPDGESEWQEIPYSENGLFGVDEAGSQGVNNKKGYFAFAIDNMLNDVYTLDESSLICGFYFFGSLKGNLKYVDKPFYIDDIKLAEDYATVGSNQ